MDKDPLILIIDDEPQILRALKTILSANHFRVSTASTGEQGIAIAVAQQPVTRQSIYGPGVISHVLFSSC